MTATVLYMSMSLDGFIAGPADDVERLHQWLFAGGDPSRPSGVPAGPPGVNGEVFDEALATGAVVTGRRTFELGNGWGGDHHDGVPIFVLTRQERETAQWPLVTYVTDVTSAMRRAKEAAGDKDVLVHGAATAQGALAAGVLDELELHVVPVLLGRGRRLFDDHGLDQLELERIRILEGEDGVTHMRYRVRR